MDNLINYSSVFAVLDRFFFEFFLLLSLLLVAVGVPVNVSRLIDPLKESLAVTG